MTAAVEEKKEESPAADAPSAATLSPAEQVADQVAEVGSSLPTDPAEYRKFVRRTAIRVARENGWCDGGLHEYLTELGLPPKGDGIKVPVTVRAVYVVQKTVMVRVDADDTAEAQSLLTGEEGDRLVKAHLGTHYVNTAEISELSYEPVVLAEDDLKLGDPDVITAAHRRCEHYSGGYYCTRERAHTGRHMAGDGTTIIYVGQAGE